MLLFWGTTDETYRPMLRQLADDWSLGDVVMRGRGELPTADNTIWPEVDRARFVLIWNGLHDVAPCVTRYCRGHGIPHGFVEWGLLPQSRTFTIDPTGFCGDSVLCGPLGWLTDADHEYLAEVRSEMHKVHPPEDGDHVLLTLQIQKDTQITMHSPFRTMREVVRCVSDRWPASRIIVKCHPKTSRRSNPKELVEGLPDRVELMTEGVFMDECAKAGVVVAVSSTCLHEAAIYGKPVLALGRHPYSAHAPERHDDVAAGVLALTLGRSGIGMAERFERFGIRPRRAT